MQCSKKTKKTNVICKTYTLAIYYCPFPPAILYLCSQRKTHCASFYHFSLSKWKQILTSAKRSSSSSSPRRASPPLCCKSAQNASIVWREKVWNHDTLSPSEWNLYVLSRTKSHSDSPHFVRLTLWSHVSWEECERRTCRSADWQAMFPAQNTGEKKNKKRATHVRQNSEKLPELFFLLIAYANSISGVAVKVLVRSFFLALRCFSVPDVSE